MSIKIKEAIILFNRSLKYGEDKMTQRKLAEKVIEGDNEKFKVWQMSRWSNGESMTSLRVEHIKLICKTLKVDANYLLDVKPIKTKE